MGDTRLTHGLAGRTRRRTPGSGQARLPARPLRPLTPVALAVGGAVMLGLLAAPASAAPTPTAAPAPAARGRVVRAGRQRIGDQARHLPPVRQRALHPGQPQRAQRPGADAQPAELHHRQRDADLPRAHPADRAHRRRHRDLRERPVRQRPGHPDRERVPLLHGRAAATDTAGLVRLLDRPDRGLQHRTGSRRSATHTNAGRAERARTRPAPWVPYTRAGCDFGSVAAADTELENTLPDVPLVFGANSPEAKEAENPKLAEQGRGRLRGPVRALRAGLARSARRPRRWPDLLPDEPGGYHGLPGAVRQQVHPPGDQPVRPGAQPQRRRSSRTPAATSASPATTA